MKLRLILILFTIFLFGTGCSVYMAAKQPEKKDVGVFNKGTPRAHVIAECGAPVQTTEEDGRKTDIFVFVQGYSSGSKAGRAFFHGAADVLTLGLWEVVGTPIEAVADGTEVKVVVKYDDKDRVDQIQALTGEEKLAGIDSVEEQIEPQGYTVESEISSEKTADEAVASLSSTKVDTIEPWTGVWEVQGSRIMSGSWGMKQSGKMVNSTKDSLYEFEGKVSGNQLKGKIFSDYNIRYDFVLTMSSDRLKFNGSAGGGIGNFLLIGNRKLENTAVITPVKLNIFEPWTGTWEVESSGKYGEGQWVLKQQGNTVKSAGDSSFDDLSAKVEGNELKGRISRGTLICPFKLKISADGQSFEGTLAGWGNIIEGLKGKRKK